MNVIMFEGYMGKGKTLGATLFAKDIEQRSNAVLYSNYGLKGAKPFTSFRSFLDVANEPSSIVVLDEAHIDLDSRSYNTNAVKFFTTLVFYLRKLRCTLILTSPLFTNIDSRVQNVTQLLVPVKKTRKEFIYPIINYETGELIRTRRIKQEDAFRISESLFDSYSMVTPLEYPQSREEFNSLLEELKIKNAEYIDSALGG